MESMQAAEAEAPVVCAILRAIGATDQLATFKQVSLLGV